MLRKAALGRLVSASRLLKHREACTQYIHVIICPLSRLKHHLDQFKESL